tara:strand:+ start:56 stop:289 length:234 start_codon:yes stop_codon:yes gene_type:complete
MGTWQLFVNGTTYIEPIDTVDLKTDIYEEAHTYFRLRKHLDSKIFNKLFVVKEYVSSKKQLGNVEWWKGEVTKLDDF